LDALPRLGGTVGRKGLAEIATELDGYLFKEDAGGAA
jgi:hypothetical protein